MPLKIFLGGSSVCGCYIGREVCVIQDTVYLLDVSKDNLRSHLEFLLRFLSKLHLLYQGPILLGEFYTKLNSLILVFYIYLGKLTVCMISCPVRTKLTVNLIQLRKFFILPWDPTSPFSINMLQKCILSFSVPNISTYLLV